MTRLGVTAELEPLQQGARARAVVVALVAGVVLVVLSVIAADGEVSSAEQRVFFWFNDLPDWLKTPAWAVQQPGVLMTPVLVGGVLWWASKQRRFFWAFVAVVPAKLIIERLIIKQFVDRPRPFTSIGPHINLRGPTTECLSFPSGHSTTAFATAVLATAFLPKKWRWLPVLAALVVGAARLYLGEHNPLDVLAGAVLGIALAVLSRAFILDADSGPFVASPL